MVWELGWVGVVVVWGGVGWHQGGCGGGRVVRCGVGVVLGWCGGGVGVGLVE